MRSRIAISVVLLGLSSLPASAAVVYNEALQGDLSGNRLAPTPVVLIPGDNDLIATMGSGELDYVRVTVPPLTQLNGIVVKAYSAFDVSFIGVQKGSTFTVDNFAAQPSDLYGYAHFDVFSGDILDDMGRGFDAEGFTPPLGPGTYTFWLQQLSGTTNYTLNFQVVPEPGAVMLVAMAGCALLARRGRHAA